MHEIGDRSRDGADTAEQPLHNPTRAENVRQFYLWAPCRGRQKSPEATRSLAGNRKGERPLFLAAQKGPEILDRLPSVLQVWTAGLASGTSLGKPIISAIGPDGIPRKTNIVAM